MSDYISRDELIKALETDYNSEWSGVDEYVDGARDEYDDVLKIVCGMKSADVQPVKRGEWEKKSSVGVFRCSLCQHIFMLGTDEIDEYHFCPHCGADMRNDSNLMKNRS